MEVGAHAGDSQDAPDKPGSQVHRFQGTQPESYTDIDGFKNIEKRVEVGAEVTSPASQVDPGEHDFSVTGFRQAMDVAPDELWGSRAFGSARSGDDAVGASAAASVLDFQKRPGSMAVKRSWAIHSTGRGISFDFLLFGTIVQEFVDVISLADSDDLINLGH